MPIGGLPRNKGLFVALGAALVVYGFAIVAAVAGGAWLDTVKRNRCQAWPR
jgi:hypothetical protein